MTPDVMRVLRDMLNRAEAGEITAIAIATVGPDLATGSAFTLGDGTLCELVGSISMLQHRLIAAGEKDEL